MNSMRVLFIFLLMMLEKRDGLALSISALCAEHLFMNLIVDLKFVFAPFSLSSYILSLTRTGLAELVSTKCHELNQSVYI